MKYLRIYFSLIAGSFLLLSSCSSEQEMDSVVNEAAASQAYLRLTLVPIQTGDSLPDHSSFGIFALSEDYTTDYISGGENVKVEYEKGKSTTKKNVTLPEDTKVPVYAYYPYADSVTLENFPIEIESQTDYLWGYSVDERGYKRYVNRGNTTARIALSHVLSQVTLHIRKDADNPKTYEVSSVCLHDAGSDFAYRRAKANILLRSLSELDFGADNQSAAVHSRGADINGVMDGTSLKSSDDVVTVKFLIIPHSYIAWPFYIDCGDNGILASEIFDKDYKSGENYVYNVIIGKGSTLTISPAEISAWENYDMSEIVVE